MNTIKQETIENFILHLQQNEIVNNNGTSIKFYNTMENKKNCGEFLVDGIKKGEYIIHFVDKLSLTLEAKGDFRFTNFQGFPTRMISLEGVSGIAILDLIKHLAIEVI